MHEIEAESGMRSERRRRSTTDEIWSGWTWTTNPIGFSERFTIRTDSHQHTNTNIGLHARTDREFLHSTRSLCGMARPITIQYDTTEPRPRRRPAARKPSMPGSRARRTSAGTSNYRTTTPACEAEGCDTHWSRRTRTSGADGTTTNQKPHSHTKRDTNGWC